MRRDDHRRLPDGLSGRPGELAEAKPGFDDGVGVERHRVDALLEQPFGQIWVVAGALAQVPTYLPRALHAFDRGADHEFDRGVAFVEAGGDQGGVAVQPESELGHVVGADREAVEMVKTRRRSPRLRQLTHHDHLKIIFAAPQAVLGQQGNDPFRFCNGPDDGIMILTLVRPLSSRT